MELSSSSLRVSSVSSSRLSMLAPEDSAQRPSVEAVEAARRDDMAKLFVLKSFHEPRIDNE